jgi:hypothetical protein
MANEKTVGDILEFVYVQGCFDALNESNKGKGKELCAKCVECCLSDLRSLLIEGLPKEYNETYVGEGLSLSYIFGYNEALKDVKSAIDRLLK